MYSPKIPEPLIPRIYHAAKRQRRPMTRLVTEAIELYLAREEAYDRPAEDARRPRPALAAWGGTP